MTGLRTLDDILPAEELVADQQSLAERWNAGIADREAASAAPAADSRADAATAPPTVGGASVPAGDLKRRKLVAGWLAAATLSVIVVILVGTQKSAGRLASRGDENRKAGNLERAIADYTGAIQLYIEANPREPKLAAIHCNRGDVFQSRGEYGRAIADYTDALRLEPRSACALRGRADAYRADGDNERGIADYIAAVRGDVDSDLNWVNRGGDLQRAGELARALQLFFDSSAVFKRLIRAEPANVRWQRDLAVSYFKAGAVLMEQDRFAEALDTYRDNLAIVRMLAAKDPDTIHLQSDVGKIVDGIGNISYHLLLKKDFLRALEATNLAILVAPTKTWLYANQAHAFMFLGRIDTARSIYLQYRGEKNVAGFDTWEAAVLDDFDAMRKAGLRHPLMNEIERRYRGRG
jgi:tetratricopeptide (TPR) repeat protein